jgi:hypothetical protein
LMREWHEFEANTSDVIFFIPWGTAPDAGVRYDASRSSFCVMGGL